MSVNNMDFSRLPSSEVHRLFHETRKLALQEKYGVAEDRPGNPRSQKSQYHLEPSGAVCDCGDPASHYPAEERFYQSEEGAMVRLEAGEERPASLEDERTERMIRMPQ